MHLFWWKIISTSHFSEVFREVLSSTGDRNERSPVLCCAILAELNMGWSSWCLNTLLHYISLTRRVDPQPKYIIGAHFEMQKQIIDHWSICAHTSYLSFFLHIPDLWLNFSPHKSAKNQHKTDFARKQRKLRQKLFFNKKAWHILCKGVLHIIHMPDVEKLQFSPYLSCGEIWNYSV